MTAAEDREKRFAVDALVYRLRNRGDADDEPLAAEFIAALWGRGWRPIEGLRPAADWRLKPGIREPGEAVKKAIEAAKALSAAHAGEFRARDRGGIPPAGLDGTPPRQEEPQ